MHSSKRRRGSADDWTILLYVGSVDDFQTPIDLALIENLEKKGPSENVNLVYQLVTASETVRGVIRGGGHPEVWTTRRPTINVTRAKHLTAFVDWAKATCPSEHTALFLKGHGEGWETPPPTVQPAREVPVDASARATPIDGSMIRGPAEGGRLGPQLHNSAIFYDGANQGRWMRTTAIRKAVERTRHGHVDVYGFDACFMSSVEVAYELRDVASYMVASEQSEISTGWPYPDIVQAVNRGTSPRDLAAMVVSKAAPTFTLASIELASMTGLAKAVSALGIALSDNVNPVADWFANNGPPNEFGANNIDLAMLLGMLDAAAKRVDLGGAVQAAIQGVRMELEKATSGAVSIFFPWCPAQETPASILPQNPLPTSPYRGVGVQAAAGAPAYPQPCPFGSPYLTSYGAVAFGRRHGWGDFLSSLNLEWINKLA